jgi:hypothetical protein
MTVRRPLTVLAATVASLALAAGPASAHYCYFKDLTPQAMAGITGSSGFISFADIVAFELPDLCSDGVDVLADAGGVSADTLINAHGLMAGGLEKQGRTNQAIGHLDFEAVIAAVPDAVEVCGAPA